ncbi:MAG: AzlD domain-containing protein [Sedimentitalea sp.]
MMELDRIQLWTVIAALAFGSYGLRFFFIGLVGNRALPDWFLRHLRYTAVAMLPALVAPLVVWPTATDGSPDAARMSAAVATLIVGSLTHNVLAAIATGAVTLYTLLYLLG